MTKNSIIALFLATVSFLSTFEPARAQVEEAELRSPVFSTELRREPTRPRAYILPPLASMILPGFDQWWERQHPAAEAYSLTAFGGAVLASTAHLPDSVGQNDIDSRRNDVRSNMLGNQIYMSAGSMSAYASFRSAVKSHQASAGKFEFLTKEESTDQLLLAPFEFHHLGKATTYVPLLVLTGLVIADQVGAQDPFRNNSFSGADLAFAGGFSYLAGTNEEALFRGFLMPVFQESFQNHFWSNTTTSLIFAAAHVSDSNPLPWPQFALGWYLGYLAQENEYTLSESIFLHAWWDVIAFTASYLNESREPRKEVWLRLPALSTTF